MNVIAVADTAVDSRATDGELLPTLVVRLVATTTPPLGFCRGKCFIADQQDALHA